MCLSDLKSEAGMDCGRYVLNNKYNVMIPCTVELADQHGHDFPLSDSESRTICTWSHECTDGHIHTKQSTFSRHAKRLQVRLTCKKTGCTWFKGKSTARVCLSDLKSQAGMDCGRYVLNNKNNVMIPCTVELADGHGHVFGDVSEREITKDVDASSALDDFVSQTRCRGAPLITDAIVTDLANESKLFFEDACPEVCLVCDMFVAKTGSGSRCPLLVVEYNVSTL